MPPGKGRVQLAQAQDSAQTFFIPISSGQVGVPFPVRIVAKPSNAVRWRTLAFRNVPGAYTFSPGSRVDDTHYVSAEDFGKIALTVSKGSPSEAVLSAVFITDDRSRESHEVKVVVLGAMANIFETGPAAVAAPRPEAPANPSPPAEPAGLDPAQENTYLQRAEKLLKLGQVAPARLLLEHLANKGSARGAQLLGDTYDEAYLRSLNVIGGVSADKEKALRWRLRAEELRAASVQQQRIN
jgi:hypothetical protein